jgi:hypothetical protein
VSEASSLTAEQLAAGREKRRARLFERYCDGARLTADERAEIADLLASVDSGAKANQLELQSSPPTKVSTRTGLEHPIQHYADLLGIGLRTAKRWLADGVKAGDACPLDDLAKFSAWWARVHPGHALNYRVAVAIENVLKGKPASSASSGAGGAQVENRVRDTTTEAKGGAVAESSAPAGPGAGAAEPAKPLLALGDVAGITFEQDLARAARIHAANMELLERAFASGSHAELDDRQRKAERSQRMLHVAQTAFDEHLKQRGDLLPREEVKRELLRYHTAMGQSLVGMLKQIGLSQEAALLKADSWFGHLRQSRFAASTAPELRPPAAATAA